MDNYQEVLDNVANDHSSGAWIVAQKAIGCVERLATEKSGAKREELVAEMERVSSTILRSQPGMAQLTNFFNAIWVVIENEQSDDTVILSRKIAGEAKRFHEHCGNAVSRTADHAVSLINEDSVVLTHSNSSTIFEILKKAKEAGITFEVVLSESRPMLEGRSLANELSKLGVPNTYFADAAISKGIDRADLVILGADSVSENTLINKIGSRAICLIGQEAVVPCYAACESSKFIARKLGPKREQRRNPDEVWQAPPSETTVENYYFDEVALELFTGVITEEGVLTPEQISGKIRSLKMSPRLLQMLK